MWGGLAFLTIFAATLLSIAFARGASGTYALWWPNGILLAILLRTKRRAWPFLLVSGAVAILLAQSLLVGWQPQLLLLTVGCLIEVWLAASILRWWANGPFAIHSLRQTARFVLIAVVAAPVVSALFVAGFLRTGAGQSFGMNLLQWYIADALGVATAAPAMLAARAVSVSQIWRRAIAMRSSGLLVLLAAGCCISLFQPDTAILTLIFPLAILIVVRMGWVAGSFSVFVLSIIASGFTTAGHGPFAAMARTLTGSRIVELQIFLVALIVSAAIIAIVYEERRRMLGQAEAKERGVRLLTDSSPDVLLVSDLSSRVLYTSRAVSDALGYQPAEINRKSFHFDLMHPAEALEYAEALDAVRSRGESRTLIYRMLRKDGSWMWAEGCISLYRDEETQEPVGFVNVVRDITHRKEAEDRLQNAYKELEALAAIDPLTGVANRRHFDAVLDAEWKRAMRSSTTIAILFIDVDHFKSYNDLYGHLKGDDCLREIAAAISECPRRSTDMSARYGGEEFAVILPDTDEAGAAALAERIRTTVESHHIRHDGNPHEVVTISIGCCSMIPARGSHFAPLIEAADKALYQAKSSGRNRVERASLLE